MTTKLTINNVYLADILLRKFAELEQLINGRLAGAVTIQAPSENMHPATKQYVDTAVSVKANTSHTHVMANVTDLAAKITEIEGRISALESPAG